MKIDIGRHIGAVSRRLENREHDGRMARVALACRTYDTTIDDLWDAITSGKRIARWFLPISGDLRLGGRYQLTGNAGGTITRCDAARLLAVTWEYGGETSWVTVTLVADSAGTRLDLEHMAHVRTSSGTSTGRAQSGRLGSRHPGARAAHRKRRHDGSRRGRGVVDLGRGQGVRARMQVMVPRLHRGGTEPAAAKARCARTTAFYTGEPPAQTDARLRHIGRPGAPPHPGAAGGRRAFLRRRRRGGASANSASRSRRCPQHLRRCAKAALPACATTERAGSTPWKSPAARGRCSSNASAACRSPPRRARDRDRAGKRKRRLE